MLRLYRDNLEPRQRERASGAGLSQTTINRLARDARDRGVAAVSVDWSFAVSLKKDLALSNQLSEALGIECDVLYDTKEASEKENSRPQVATSERHGVDERTASTMRYAMGVPDSC